VRGRVRVPNIRAKRFKKQVIRLLGGGKYLCARHASEYKGSGSCSRDSRKAGSAETLLLLLAALNSVVLK
jgi:hypothetical protein